MKDWTKLEVLIEHYIKIGVTFFNHDGIYYYKSKPCEKVDEIPLSGKVIDQINDYPAGNYLIYDNDYIAGKTISGDVKLKILSEVK
ncbi:MAG: hypothetical protein AABY22_14490 [Nanoarchaeota archaeon]